MAFERPQRTSQTSRSQPNQPAVVSMRTFKMSHKQANCFGELFQKNAIAITSIHLIMSLGDFPGRPVVMTPSSQCRGHGWLDPWLGELRSHMLHGADRRKKSLETMTFNEGSEKMGQETGQIRWKKSKQGLEHGVHLGILWNVPAGTAEQPVEHMKAVGCTRGCMPSLLLFICRIRYQS